MTDTVPPDVRAKMMKSIQGVDTVPERLVRRYLHAVGLRFRCHVRTLPGSPDLIFPSRRIAVFVHGCFWHRHPGCRFAATPATRPEFWRAKFAANNARDRAAEDRLTSLGWQVMTIWECEAKDELALDSLAWALLAAPVLPSVTKQPANTSSTSR
jgi:DNA mismatch endonuclease, patch repair protein